MKKIIKTLILVLVVVLALTVFVACNEEPETTTAPVCKHTGGTATCTEAAVCELCGESYGEALGHTGGEATCTTLAVCATCGENYGELKAHELEAFGEDLPTCTEDGLSSGVVCSVCGYQERRRFPIPALGHDMADATCELPSTCTRKDCGYTEGEALGHDMVEVEALAPTCTAEGYTAHLGCSRCDLTEGKEAVAINPDAHTLVDVAEQAPTCEAVGYTAHKACACGYTEGKEEIAATGHSFTVAVEELAPTTCENGYTAHNECAVCGTPDENYEVLYASHNFTEESYFYYPAPTCTAGGYLAGTCTECGSSFYLEELAPLGHDVEATCTEGGTCSVCGEVVEALGHTWVDADCDTAKTCSVCGATEGEALGHSYVDGICDTCGATDPNHYFVVSISDALAAADGKKVEVSGTVSAINTAWSDSYGNISVTIVDANGNELYIYRLKTNVALGDIITVKGTMATYNENRQIAAGATATITGHDSSYDYTEMSIVDAIAAADNTNVIVTGTVVKINTAYSSSYNNISVTIADDNGTQLYVYRLAGGSDLAVGDIVTIKGAMDTYSGSRQIAGGTYTEVGTHTCAKWTDATCAVPATCIVCGTAKDDVLSTDHNYVDGRCTVCNGVDPDFEGEVVELATESLSIFANTGSLSGTVITWTGSSFTFVTEKGTNNNAIRTSDSDHFRVYQGNVVTISGSKITKIVITCTSSSYATVCAGSLTTTGVTASVSGSVVTLTVDSGSLDSIVIGATAQWRLNNVEVTYEK